MDNNKPHLYHYTNADSLFKILDNLTLRLGTFDKVNDPKESKNWNFKFFCLKPESKASFNDNLFDRISSFILKNSKIICLTKDNDIPNPDDIVHLRKGYSYPRMWAQYADKHKGACLVFDKEGLENSFDSNFSDKISFKGDVEYLNTVYGPKITEQGLPVDPYGIFYEQLEEEGFDNYILKHIKKFHKCLYLFKHFNWRDENEFRFVVLDQTPNNELFLPIKNSLKSILITEDFPKKLMPELIQRCKTLNIKLDWMLFRGWATHILPIPTEAHNQRDVISLDGISFPIHFDYEMLYTQACDFKGKMRTLLFDFKDDGKLKLLK